MQAARLSRRPQSLGSRLPTRRRNKCRKLEERRRTVLWGRTAGLLAETALAARGLLRLDLSDCDWLSAEHLIRCSGLLVELQVTASNSIRDS
jgi:hypothetical protein